MGKKKNHKTIYGEVTTLFMLSKVETTCGDTNVKISQLSRNYFWKELGVTTRRFDQHALIVLGRMLFMLAKLLLWVGSPPWNQDIYYSTKLWQFPAPYRVQGRVRMIDFGCGYGRWQGAPALKHRQTRWSSHSRSQSRSFGCGLIVIRKVSAYFDETFYRLAFMIYIWGLKWTFMYVTKTNVVPSL